MSYTVCGLLPGRATGCIVRHRAAARERRRDHGSGHLRGRRHAAGLVTWPGRVRAGRTGGMTQTVSEPEPGRVLVESGQGVSTTFTVQPDGAGCRVRFDTRLEDGGLEGMLTRLFAPRLLQPVYQ